MAASQAQPSFSSLSRRHCNIGVCRHSTPARHALTPVAQAVIWASMSAVAWALPAFAHAQGTQAVAVESRHHFDIPSGSLDQALGRFGRQSGEAISVNAALTSGLNSPGLRGDYIVGDALRRLLSGTGLQAVRDSTGEYTLRPLPTPVADGNVATLPAVKVVGSADSGAEQVNPPTTVGSKIPLAQREIPQSITVIPQAQIQQQNMQTLNDAVRYAPGMTLEQSDSERTTFYSRGFPVSSWMIDGLPTATNNTSAAPNLAMYDRVEVLRGPDGFMNGFGSEGGTVNLVRKRAPGTFSMSAELQGGTYNDFGGTIDVGGPLNSSGTLRGRVVGNLQSQDLMWDTSWRRDKLLYGTLEADLTPTTTLRLGASYSEMSQKAEWTGVPTYAMPSGGQTSLVNVARSTYLGAPWNRNDYSSTTAFAELDQKLGGGWSGKLAFNYLGTSASVLNGQVGTGVDPISNEAGRGDTKWYETDQQELIDAFLSGPVRLLGRTHQLTVGATYQHEDYRGINHYCGSADSSSGDIWCSSTESIYASFPRPAFDGPVSDESTTQDQYGLYANARISLADPLTLVLGARATWWSTHFNPSANANYWGDSPSKTSVTGKITPYVGLVYDLNDTYSLYASYTTIFNPQTAHDYAGNVLPPLEGVQYETGIKGEYLGGKLNASLALFQLTEQNRAMDDPRFPVGSGYEVAQGRARSQGIEATISGQLTPNWSIAGGYTYTQAKYLDSSTNSTTGVGFSSMAPKHQFKLWTNYRLPGDLNKFSVGGGVRVSSEIWGSDNHNNTLRQGGYAVVDARVGYQINRRLSAALNVTNLFDRHYFESLGNGAFYGNPRQILLTLRYAM